MAIPDGKGFLSVRELQSLLGISRTSVYALVHRNGFPAIRVGNRIIIPTDLFHEWVQDTAGMWGGDFNG